MGIDATLYIFIAVLEAFSSLTRSRRLFIDGSKSRQNITGFSFQVAWYKPLYYSWQGETDPKDKNNRKAGHE